MILVFVCVRSYFSIMTLHMLLSMKSLKLDSKSMIGFVVCTWLPVGIKENDFMSMPK